MIKILEGENTFLSHEKLLSLISELKKEKPNSIITILKAEQIDADEINKEYQSQNMFSKEKILVIKRLLLNKRWKEVVEDLLERKDSLNDIDILIWEDGKIAKNTRYYKNFNSVKAIESFPKSNKRSFLKWAKEILEEKKIVVEPNTLNNLIVLTNADYNAFLNEVKKFEILEKNQITQKDLELLTNSIQDYDIWNFIDALNTENNKKEIVEILEKFEEKRVDPSYLITMIARNLKQIILINKLLEDGYDNKEIISAIKIPPFTFPKLKSLAKRNNLNNLIDTYKKLYNLDYSIKTGDIEGQMGLLLLSTQF